MSTDRSRLVSSIRRIVLQDPEIRDLIDEFRNRGGFGSTSATIEGAEDARRICCDGSVSGNANPGSDTKDPGEDSQEGMDDNDPADIGSGRLTGVTDCATGEDICLEGLDWIPPEGWDSPTDPPIDPDAYYEEGFYWDCGGSEYRSPSSKGSCAENRDDNHSSFTEYNGSNQIDDDTVDHTFAEPEPSNNTVTLRSSQRSCTITPDPACDEDPPLAESWPEDGCTNLAIKNGTIVGSKFDPENDGSYSKPMSEIELCDEFGNSFFLSPASNGGWKTIDSTKTDGYLYDSQGNKIAHIDGNEYADPDV